MNADSTEVAIYWEPGSSYTTSNLGGFEWSIVVPRRRWRLWLWARGYSRAQVRRMAKELREAERDGRHG